MLKYQLARQAALPHFPHRLGIIGARRKLRHQAKQPPVAEDRFQERRRLVEQRHLLLQIDVDRTEKHLVDSNAGIVGAEQRARASYLYLLQLLSYGRVVE